MPYSPNVRLIARLDRVPAPITPVRTLYRMAIRWMLESVLCFYSEETIDLIPFLHIMRSAFRFQPSRAGANARADQHNRGVCQTFSRLQPAIHLRRARSREEIPRDDCR